MCTTLTIVSIEFNTFFKTISPSLYGVSKAECNTITVRLCVDPLCLELLYRFDRENNCLLRSKVLSLHSVKCSVKNTAWWHLITVVTYWSLLFIWLFLYLLFTVHTCEEEAPSVAHWPCYPWSRPPPPGLSLSPLSISGQCDIPQNRPVLLLLHATEKSL